MGQITLTAGATGYQRFIAADETGINIESIETVTKPEFKDFLMDRTGHKFGFAVGDPEQEITIKGEIKTGAGTLNSANFYAAITLANSTTYYGASGGIYLDEATITEEREGWKKGSWKLSRNKNIA